MNLADATPIDLNGDDTPADLTLTVGEISAITTVLDLAFKLDLEVLLCMGIERNGGCRETFNVDLFQGTNKLFSAMLKARGAQDDRDRELGKGIGVVQSMIDQARAEKDAS